MRNQLLGNRYRILDRIGEGGMAYVYLALDEKLGRKVAIKVLHEHMERNADIRKRFQLEAEAVSRLEHPNIVKIYDFSGGESDRLWIVTEVIRGKNLAQYVEKGPTHALHPVIATCIVREILKALTRAHDLGIIHRDIKPENVMITSEGRVKLMDFGIAKDLGRSNVTQTGTFMGSPSYMSAEQIRGKDVDQRSDLYSLSVLFYEIITNRLPFVGQTTHEVVMRIVEGSFTEPRFIVPTLPDQLNDLIVKGMAKNPQDRHDSAKTYGAILDQFLAQSGFDESHIELERYFDDKKAFEERLAQTAILPPEAGEQGIRLRDSRHLVEKPKDPTQKQTAAKIPAPPFVTERRTVPRSYGAKRFKSSPSSASLAREHQAPGAGLPPPPRSQTPRQIHRAPVPSSRTEQQTPESSSKSPERKPSAHISPAAPASRSIPASSHRSRPVQPLPSAFSAMPPSPPRAAGTRPQAAMFPPRTRRLLRAQRIVRRRSRAPQIRPVRIAIVRPSFLSRVTGFTIIGLILGMSAWGFWQLNQRLTLGGRTTVEDTDKDEGRASQTEGQRPLPSKTRVTKIRESKVSSVVGPPVQARKGRDLATNSLKALKPDRGPAPKTEHFTPSMPQGSGVSSVPRKKQPKPSTAKTGAPSISQLNKNPRIIGDTIRSQDDKKKVTPQPIIADSSRGQKQLPPSTVASATPVKEVTTQVPNKPAAVTKDKASKDEPKKPESPRENSASGRFKISSQPASEIFVDGQRLGTTVDSTTHSGWLSLSAGKHDLELKRQGYDPHKMSLSIKPGEDTTIPSINLVRSSDDTAAPSGKVSLTLRVNMLPAQVSVRHLDANTTQVFAMKSPTKTLQLSTGRYLIKIEHQGEIKEREINLTLSQGDLTFSADFKNENFKSEQ